MSSRTARGNRGTAAWRITLLSSLAFAIGTALAFAFLQQYLERDIQESSDAWLAGELGVLADVAERTPADKLHDEVVGEVAELASREVPHDEAEKTADAVFFVEMSPAGALELHTGAASASLAADAIAGSNVRPLHVSDVSVQGFAEPFRVATSTLPAGDHVYLGLSTHHEREVLKQLRQELVALWLLILSLGSVIVYFSSRRVLSRVQTITDTAETIGQSNLGSRVPASDANDEIARLAQTLNRMLDRVQVSVQQLHAMSDALAHDLRSPLTAIRGKLETALVSEVHDEREASIVQCIDGIDRLSALLNTSLDVSEAGADALRLRKEPVDLGATVRTLAEVYEPVLAHAGLTLRVHASGQAWISADAGLIQRALSNLFDNALKHLPPGSSVSIFAGNDDRCAFVGFEDDGNGFAAALLPRVFERFARGADSPGFGLGLAFVEAVARSHDGSAVAENRPEGGARVVLTFPRKDPDGVPVPARHPAVATAPSDI